ncbi:MAG: hypothetical protein AAFO69_13755 [Bacteroidota bacterium]
MKRYLFALLLLFPVRGYSQIIKEIYPDLIEPLTFSIGNEKKFNQHLKDCEEVWTKLRSLEEGGQLTAAEQKVLDSCDEMERGYWDTEGPGCSWYCGGGPYRITASSVLVSQGIGSYKAENAHDFSYQTAWVEGVKGQGIGEYLEYSFKAESPRVTRFIIANGYVKSHNAWKNNSRVKKLKMYYNDEPIGILHLSDRRANHFFSIDPLGSSDRENFQELKNKPDWTLKFEILEVYPGAQYDDTVISEIRLEGLDVHCFIEGTLVTMADGSRKEIQDISIGDKVSSLNTESIPVAATVQEVATKVHSDLIKINFTNGNSITCTKDHPLLGLDNRWYAFSPEKTIAAYQFDEVYELKTGMELHSKNASGKQMISTIAEVSEARNTYTIVSLERSNVFIANDIYVGTEALRVLKLRGSKKYSPSQK